MAELRVAVAGLTVAINLPHAGWVPPLHPRLGKYLTAGAPDLTLDVALTTDPARAPGGEPRVEEDESGLYLRHDNFEGHLPPTGPASLTIVQTDSEPDDGTYGMVVDSMLRLMLAQALAGRGGVMFHAAGIATGPDAGWVFFGPSGSGKTTICRLSHPRYRVLCDEVVAVVPDERGDYRLYGTPFAGAWGDSLPEDVPLKELFYLKQAPATRRVPLPVTGAVSALLESAVVYHRSLAFSERLFDLLLALVGRVPVTQLEFVAKESLWETVLPPAPTR